MTFYPFERNSETGRVLTILPSQLASVKLAIFPNPDRKRVYEHLGILSTRLVARPWAALQAVDNLFTKFTNSLSQDFDFAQAEAEANGFAGEGSAVSFKKVRDLLDDVSLAAKSWTEFRHGYPCLAYLPLQVPAWLIPLHTVMLPSRPGLDKINRFFLIAGNKSGRNKNADEILRGVIPRVTGGKPCLENLMIMHRMLTGGLI